jgi:hypothetical protein
MGETPKSEFPMTVEEVMRQFVKPEFKQVASLVASVATLEERNRHAGLLRTAAAFIEELKAFGYGETSEKALPGAYDPFARAVAALKD